MYKKTPAKFKSPDLSQLQEVVIDVKTKIYIAIGADPEEARSRYKSKFGVNSFGTWLKPALSK